jgi:hypothetical protein
MSTERPVLHSAAVIAEGIGPQRHHSGSTSGHARLKTRGGRPEEGLGLPIDPVRPRSYAGQTPSILGWGRSLTGELAEYVGSGGPRPG